MSSTTNPWNLLSDLVKQGKPPADAKAVGPSESGKHQEKESKGRPKGEESTKPKEEKRLSSSSSSHSRPSGAPSQGYNFNVDKFLVELYNFAENNAPSRGAPLYWYDTVSKMWMPGVAPHSLGTRPFDKIAPVFFGQYPYPVFYPGNKVEFGSLYQRRSSAPSRNSQRLNKHSIAPQEREQFGIRIVDGQIANGDARTSIMIRNIPNKYTQQMLLAEIEPYKGQFDLFYLPIDFHNKCNVGYAFCNFVDAKYIPAFYEHFHGLRWSQFNSAKVCELTYARIQGQKNMLKHFQNSRVLIEHPIYRPVVFSGTELDNSWPERVLQDAAPTDEADE